MTVNGAAVEAQGLKGLLEESDPSAAAAGHQRRLVCCERVLRHDTPDQFRPSQPVGSQARRLLIAHHRQYGLLIEDAGGRARVEAQPDQPQLQVRDPLARGASPQSAYNVLGGAGSAKLCVAHAEGLTVAGQQEHPAQRLVPRRVVKDGDGRPGGAVLRDPLSVFPAQSDASVGGWDAQFRFRLRVQRRQIFFGIGEGVEEDRTIDAGGVAHVAGVLTDVVPLIPIAGSGLFHSELPLGRAAVFAGGADRLPYHHIVRPAKHCGHLVGDIHFDPVGRCVGGLPPGLRKHAHHKDQTDRHRKHRARETFRHE